MASLLVGALLGALLTGSLIGPDALVWGAALGAAVGAGLRLGVLAQRVESLRRQLEAHGELFRELRAEVDALRGRAGPAAAPVAAAPAAPAQRVEPAAARPAPPPRATAAEPVAAEPVAAAPAWLGRGIAAVRAYFTTGNPVARVGVVVLFFGVAFLLKYVAERAVVPIELRLAGVAGGGLALLAVGWRLRARAGYGLILQGAGIGTLYLTTFAALRLYGLLPPSLAFAVLVAVVVLSAALALLQDSRSLAFLGSAGGFLAPVLTASPDGSHVVLFSYFTLLNLGIFAIAWARAWRSLNLLGFAFTFVIVSAWGHRAYRPELFATTEPFLVLFFVLYVGISVLFASRQPPRLKGYVDGTLVFGVPVAGFGLQAALVRGSEFGLAYSALAAGALYLALTAALRRRGAGPGLLTQAFLALGIAFTTLAVPLALDARATAATWALEGAALLWVGLRQRRLLPRASGVALQLAAGVSFLVADAGTAGPPLLNRVVVGAALVAGAGLFGAFCYERYRESARPVERGVALVLLGWGVLWWLGAGLAEIDRLLDGAHQLLAVVGFLALSALALDRAAARLRWRAGAVVPVLLLPALGLVGFALGVRDGRIHLFSPWGAAAWLAAVAVHFFLLRAREREWPAELARGWHMGGLWLMLAGLSAESAWAVGHYAAEGTAWRYAVWAVVPVVGLSVLAALPRSRWPLTRHGDAYQGAGLVPVAVYLFGWSWLACFVLASPAPLPYWPLLNPLELAQAAVLLLLLRWWLRAGRAAVGAPLHLAAVPVALGVAAFMLLNGTLARSVAVFTGIPFTGEALFHSMAFQSGLSILWSCLALGVMRASAQRGLPALWFTGSGLLAVVVLKLFAVELANSGTVARIVSFVVVGLLMLLIGYLAPIPTRQARRVAP